MPGGIHGREGAWQERRPLKRTVRILLECILVYHFIYFKAKFVLLYRNGRRRKGSSDV